MDFRTLLGSTALIAAHRGVCSFAPENSLSSLEASVTKCDFIEIDVQLSKEGSGIVLHDETLERTTDIAKIPKFAARAPYRVCDFTLDELKELNYGFYKDSHEPLLTLGRALEFLQERQMFLNIEIKDMSHLYDDEHVVAQISQEIKDAGVSDKIMISSFYHAYLPLFQTALPGVLTAALVEGVHPPHLVRYLKKLGVDAYHCEFKLATKRVVTMLRLCGWYVGVYTVNSPLDASELFDIGVNYIFSDSLCKGETR